MDVWGSTCVPAKSPLKYLDEVLNMACMMIGGMTPNRARFVPNDRRTPTATTISRYSNGVAVIQP